MTGDSNEALETAIRDYVGAVLDGQGELMAILADIQAKQADILAEIANLKAAYQTKLTEQESRHAAEFDIVAAGQANVLAVVKSAGTEIAGQAP